MLAMTRENVLKSIAKPKPFCARSNRRRRTRTSSTVEKTGESGVRKVSSSAQNQTFVDTMIGAPVTWAPSPVLQKDWRVGPASECQAHCEPPFTSSRAACCRLLMVFL